MQVEGATEKKPVRVICVMFVTVGDIGCGLTSGQRFRFASWWANPSRFGPWTSHQKLVPHRPMRLVGRQPRCNCASAWQWRTNPGHCPPSTVFGHWDGRGWVHCRSASTGCQCFACLRQRPGNDCWLRAMLIGTMTVLSGVGSRLRRISAQLPAVISVRRVHTRSRKLLSNTQMVGAVNLL